MRYDLSGLWCGDGKAAAQMCRELFPDSSRGVVAAADGICGNTFIFDDKWDMEKSLAPVTFERDIDWQSKPGGDMEWVYEFNRHGCLLTLAKAYALTADERYTRHYARLLLDWIANVPLTEESVKTAWRPIDAAIRSENWLRSLQVFRGSIDRGSIDPGSIDRGSIDRGSIDPGSIDRGSIDPGSIDRGSIELPPGLIAEAERSMRIHAKYLAAAHGDFQRLSNWGVIQDSGLFLLGLYLHMPEYVDLSVRRLNDNLRLQVLPDGVHWEQSPQYHSEVLRRMLTVVRAAGLCGVGLPDGFAQTVHRMAAALVLWIKPNGRLPCQSDSDDVDARGLLLSAAALFNDAGLMAYAGGGCGALPSGAGGGAGLSVHAGDGCGGGYYGSRAGNAETGCIGAGGDVGSGGGAGNAEIGCVGVGGGAGLSVHAGGGCGALPSGAGGGAGLSVHAGGVEIFEENLWELGVEGASAIRKLGAPPVRPGCVAFEQSGNYILRDGGYYLHMHCGGLGSGHGHADLLHIDLYAHGEDILIDSGRYNYQDAPIRRTLKSPAAHNTITADGKDFTVYKNAWEYDTIALPIRVGHYFAGAGAGASGYIGGGNLGYWRDGIIIIRKAVQIVPGLYVLFDTIYANGSHSYTQYFHFNNYGDVRLEGADRHGDAVDMSRPVDSVNAVEAVDADRAVEGADRHGDAVDVSRPVGAVNVSRPVGSVNAVEAVDADRAVEGTDRHGDAVDADCAVLCYRGKTAQARLVSLSKNAKLTLAEAPLSRTYNELEQGKCLHIDTASEKTESFAGLVTVIAAAPAGAMCALDARLIPVRLARTGETLPDQSAQAVRAVWQGREYTVICMHAEVISEVSLIEAGGCKGYGKLMVFSSDASGARGPCDMPGTRGPCDMPGARSPYDVLGAQDANDIGGVQDANDIGDTQGPYDMPGAQGPYDAPGATRCICLDW